MTTAIRALPRLFDQLCDDAAVFPPGNLPLDRAVPAHLEHLVSGHQRLVGPFVVAAVALPQLADLVADRPTRSVRVSKRPTRLPAPAGRHRSPREDGATAGV